jgi:hypothetical protein
VQKQQQWEQQQQQRRHRQLASSMHGCLPVCSLCSAYLVIVLASIVPHLPEHFWLDYL